MFDPAPESAKWEALLDIEERWLKDQGLLKNIEKKRDVQVHHYAFLTTEKAKNGRHATGYVGSACFMAEESKLVFYIILSLYQVLSRIF